MDVSVIIVSFNSAHWAKRCVQSIQHWTHGLQYEVIVVDNASPDGSGSALKAALPGATVIQRRRNGGFSVAANDGAHLARGRLLLFLNPDTTLEGDLLGLLSAYLLDHPDAGAIGPRLLDSDGGLQLSCRRFPSHRTALFNRYSLLTRLLPGNRQSRDYLLSGWRHDQIRDVDWLSGACLMLPRRVFEQVGGFDEGLFFSAEDVDLCLRLNCVGYRVVYNPAVSVTHTIGASSRTVPNRIIIARHLGMWRYYRKHLRGGRLLDGVTLIGIGARFLLQLVLTNAGRFSPLRRFQVSQSEDSRP
ncbi:MAG: glycosyltransferase family 2 protein [Dehalococcoidia bacterium]